MTVTSNAPVPSAAAFEVTADGFTDNEPSVVENGTLNLSPLNPTPCWTTALTPFTAGAATTSSLWPVDVLKPHVPLPR